MATKKMKHSNSAIPKFNSKKSSSSKSGGKRRNKKAAKDRAKRAAEQGNKRFYKDLRLKQKAANERMRQLELQGIKSPAYQAVQAQLEILGKRKKGKRGRRFSETGKATYNEMELQLKILDDFLNAKTSKLRGAKDYQKQVWESADKNNKLSQAGISRDDWLHFWESMPDKKDRMFGSSQIVAMVRAYSLKNGQLEDENKLSIEEIADEIQASKNLKQAYKSLGLTYTEVSGARIKRDLRGI